MPEASVFEGSARFAHVPNPTYDGARIPDPNSQNGHSELRSVKDNHFTGRTLTVSEKRNQSQKLPFLQPTKRGPLLANFLGLGQV